MLGESVKKFLAFGLGAAALTSEKLKQFADDAVARGEMSTDEARKFVDDVQARAEEEKKNMQVWIRDQVNKVVMAGGAADANRVAQIEGRLDAIERRLDMIMSRLPQESPKPDEPPMVTSE